LKDDIGTKALKQVTGLEPFFNKKILVFTSEWTFSALFSFLKARNRSTTSISGFFYLVVGAGLEPATSGLHRAAPATVRFEFQSCGSQL